jgi:tetratricopeptide (TPR) repeat protein
MKLLNKPKIIFFVALAVFLLTFLLNRQNESVINKGGIDKSKYQPSEINDIPDFSSQYLEYLKSGRNPFTSSVQKVSGEADIGLPPVVIKKPTYCLFSPMPESSYYNAFVYYVPADKLEYQYSINRIEQNDLPIIGSLLSGESVEKLIESTENKTSVIDEERKAIELFTDKIYFYDNTFSKGKVLMEDEQKIIFQEESKKYFVSYSKDKIRKIDRVYSFEEQYTKKAKDIRNEDALAHYELACWCIEKKLIKQAIFELQQSLKINNTQLDLYLLTADLYRQRMDLENELKIYHNALQTTVLKKEVIYIRMGELYDILNREDEALNAFSLAVQSAPNSLTALLKLSYAHYKKGDYKSSESVWEKVNQISSIDSGTVVMNGMLRFKKGELSKSRDLLKDGLNKILSGNKGISIVSTDQIYAILGVVNALLKNYTLASECFFESIRINSFRSSNWVNMAMLYLIAGDFNITAKILDVAQKRDPSSALPFLGKGYLFWCQDKINEAKSNFQKAVKIEPLNVLVQYALGQVYFAEGNIKEAISMFSGIVKQKPLILDSLYYLGIILFQESRFQESNDYFKLYFNALKANYLQSDQAMLGITYLAINKLDNARSCFEQLIAMNPHFVLALSGLGYLEYKSNNKDKAMAYFNNILKLYNNDSYSINSLASIKEAHNQIIWKDIFARDDNLSIGEGWIEREKPQIESEVFNKSLRLKGKQSENSDNGITFIMRSINKNNFIRLDAELEIQGINKAGVGIFVAVEEARFKEALFYGIIPSNEGYNISWQGNNFEGVLNSKWKEISDIPRGKNKVKLSIQKSINSNNQIDLKLYINDKKVFNIPASSARFINASKDYLVGVFGYAPGNTEWELIVKSIKITEKKEE